MPRSDRRKVVDQDSQDSYRLEYALMIMQAGKEEEGRKDLALSRPAKPPGRRGARTGRYRFPARQSRCRRTALQQSGFDGRFVYESLFYLGAIAEPRDAWDEAMQIYGRVTGGDFAMAAQSRAARLKAKRKGSTPG